MNELIKKVLKFQKEKDEYLFEEIISELDNIINFQCSKIIRSYKKDLKQELLFEIFKEIPHYEPKKQLIKGNLEYDEICTILHNTTKSKYYPLFQTKYQIDERLIYYQDVNQMIELINEFYLFCNENQFRKYIKIICEKRRIDFCRKYKVSQNAKNISLNIVTDDGEELIDKLMDPFFEHENNEIDYRLLSSKDIDFLNLFIAEGKVLTEKEVAKKLGVTQQAVSSMLKRIAKRYRNELNQ